MPRRDEPDLYLGLDLGTSGVRAVAVDRRGGRRAVTSAPLEPPLRGPAGASEQDPDHWWHAAVVVIRQLTARLEGQTVRSVTVDGTSATLLLSAEDGTPLTPALMYDDTRASAFAPRLVAVAPADCAVHGASSSLAKLLLLMQRTASARNVRALHQADWIQGKLTGRFGISDENNCLKLGYDPVNRRWPDWMAGLALPPGLLPAVYAAGTPIGRVCDAASRLTGLPADCMVTTGTTDGVAAALASGVSGPGEAVTSLGSTLVVKVLARAPLFVAEYGIYSHRLGDEWLVGGASNSGAAILARFFTRERLEELSARIDPDRPSGLTYYPLLRPGERFPHNDPDFQPRMLPRPNDDVRFLQGLLEGIADIECRGYRLLAELGAPYPLRVWSIGGGAVNPVWRRIRQARLGVPVIRAAHGEAAHGAALLGLRAVGGLGRTDD